MNVQLAFGEPLDQNVIVGHRVASLVAVRQEPFAGRRTLRQEVDHSRRKMALPGQARDNRPDRLGRPWEIWLDGGRAPTRTLSTHCSKAPTGGGPVPAHAPKRTGCTSAFALSH